MITDRIQAAQDAVASAADVATGTLQDWELASSLSRLARLEAQVASLELDILAEAERRRVADETGDTGTDAWAATLTGTTRGVMSGGLWLARLLRERYHATREAFATGAVNETQVRVIVKAAETLPDQVTQEQRAEAERLLVEKATSGVNSRRLRQAARRMLDKVDRELADRHESEQLIREEERAEAETWLNLCDNGDGTFSGRFVIPELQGHLLRNALEKLSAPRRLSRDTSGRPVVDQTVVGEGPSLNWSERLGAAFVELLEHLPTDGHGAVGATLLVRLGHRNLVDGLASGRLDTGAGISAGQARRLACNAGIVPVVLGGRSEPLDVGKERRLHTTAMRRALSVRHDSCAARGCERPFAWCEIHHPHAWADGGGTSVDNAVPLCGHHHRRVHDRRFDARYLPNGEVRFHRRR